MQPMKRLTISLGVATLLALTCAVYFSRVADRLLSARGAFAQVVPAVSLGASNEVRARVETAQKRWRAASPWIRTESNEELRRQREQLVSRIVPTDAAFRVYDDQIRIRLKYQRLYRELGLSPQQIERFEVAAAENFGAIDVFGFTLGQYPPEQEAQHLEGAARNLDDVVRATLGDEAVPVFRDFISTADLREQVSSLAVSSFNAGAPLTPAQGDALLLLSVDRSSTTGAEVRIDPRSVDWMTVEREAEKFLTPPQLEALRGMNARKAFDAEFRRITGLPYRRPIRGL